MTVSGVAYVDISQGVTGVCKCSEAGCMAWMHNGRSAEHQSLAPCASRPRMGFIGGENFPGPQAKDDRIGKSSLYFPDAVIVLKGRRGLERVGGLLPCYLD